MKPFLYLNKHFPDSIVTIGSLTISFSDEILVSTSVTPESSILDQKTAIKLSELVLPIYENDYPNDDRPRKAIAAAKNYLANPTDENLQLLAEARNTIDADSCASWAAYLAATAAAHAASDATSHAAYWAVFYASAALYIEHIEIDQAYIEKSTLKSDSWVKLCEK